MDATFVLIAIAVVAAIITAGILVHRHEQRRRDALAALATELGWHFDPRRDRSHDAEYANFEIFRRGHSRCALNTLSGSIEILGRSYQCKMGDFKYKVTSGSGKNRRTTTYRFSYLIVHMPFPGVPALIIRRENMFDRVKGFFGFPGISFESVEFNRQFHVNGPDKRFAYAVIEPRIMEFLMKTDPKTIDIERGRMCLSDGRRRWSPEEFRQQIDWTRAFFEHWPKHVKEDLASRALT